MPKVLILTGYTSNDNWSETGSRKP